MSEYSFKGKLPYNNHNSERNNFSRNEGGNNAIGNFEIKLRFNDKDVITDDRNSNYVDIARDVVEKGLKRDKGNLNLTTSQIRNIMSLLAEIYKNVSTNESQVLSADLQARIQYFRLKCVYQAGREDSVKDFMIKSNLLDVINLIGDNKNRFISCYHYIEALVAWHKFNGGKEQ